MVIGDTCLDIGDTCFAIFDMLFDASFVIGDTLFVIGDTSFEIDDTLFHINLNLRCGNIPHARFGKKRNSNKDSLSKILTLNQRPSGVSVPEFICAISD